MTSDRGDTPALPAYNAVPFTAYEHITAFLRDAETENLLQGQSPDETVRVDAIARLLSQLGHPNRAYRSIHVTGTNGKTTVSRMLSALLHAAGLKVGLYTSPRIGHPHHCICIDGRPISEQEFVDACNQLRPYMDWEGIKLSPFEFSTVAAFFAFRLAKVDYAVIEVGIGGRRDATNILAPDIAVITNVAADHQDILGHSLEAIATEKAGIIKPFTPVICGAREGTPRTVIEAVAAQLHAPVRLFGRDYDIGPVRMEATSTSGAVHIGSTSWPELTLQAPGPFMTANAAHALAAFDLLTQRGHVNALRTEQVQHLFATMRPTDWCEFIDGHPPLLIDGAHNAAAMAALAFTVRTVWERYRPIFVIAIPADKDHRTILHQLVSTHASRVLFTRCPSLHCIDPHVLARDWVTMTSAAADVVQDPASAMTQALATAGPDQIVVVSGSLHLAHLSRSLMSPTRGHGSQPLPPVDHSPLSAPAHR